MAARSHGFYRILSGKVGGISWGSFDSPELHKTRTWIPLTFVYCGDSTRHCYSVVQACWEAIGVYTESIQCKLRDFFPLKSESKELVLWTPALNDKVPRTLAILHRALASGTLSTYIHTCIHTYIHACKHACIHACMQYMHTCITCMHAYMHTCIACIRIYLHACIHTYTHTYIRSYIQYIHTYRQTDRPTDRQRETDRQTDGQTDINTYIHSFIHTCIHATYTRIIHTCIHTCMHAYIHT